MLIISLDGSIPLQEALFLYIKVLLQHLEGSHLLRIIKA